MESRCFVEHPALMVSHAGVPTDRSEAPGYVMLQHSFGQLMQSVVLPCGRSELASLPSICGSPGISPPAAASARVEPARENAQLQVRTMQSQQSAAL